MSEMVERVAKAMMGNMFAPHELSTRMGDPELFGKYCSTAREAIAAMREPTAEMLAIRTEPVLRVGDPELPRVQQWRDALWRGMIDEALK